MLVTIDITPDAPDELVRSAIESCGRIAFSGRGRMVAAFEGDDARLNTIVGMLSAFGNIRVAVRTEPIDAGVAIEPRVHLQVVENR